MISSYVSDRIYEGIAEQNISQELPSVETTSSASRLQS